MSQETSRRTPIESFIDIEEDASDEYHDNSHKEMCLELQNSRSARKFYRDMRNMIGTAMDRK